MGRRNGQKGKLVGWDKNSLIGQQRKCYYYYYCLCKMNYTQCNFVTTLWPICNQSVIMESEMQGFSEFRKTPEKDRTPEKVWTHGQERIRTLRKEKEFLPPDQSPFIKWAWCLWYGIFPLASLALCLAVLPPGSCTLAHHQNTRNWWKSLIS